ncbi:Uma2 family endonuclease [Oscillatoria sp. FACHB-1407]|uniref:Uma2 family endonuclease n=1 Tax=Oscillatoria sp. FACHB-1407 TaxID=2692847 RepID=UPI001689FA56|nr:Uma2 family endonuclease [Oscillatoria sp. FACHB-1407]MBD2459916.1 Uma2 family endonuclease [Oscillatoria sp. FACHB-1407]
MVVTSHRADRVLLHSISWEQFERLLEDLGDHRAARIAYDNGTLEIMTPLLEHQYFKEVISDSIQDVAEELEIDYESYGSTTWRKRIKMAGVEPDNCFYFQNEPIVRGRLDLDLSQGDPPPDLALEIDITSKSLDRFPIYARLEVPELWCYDEGELKIYHLQDGKYVEAEISLALPQLPIRELPQLIETHRTAGRRAIRRAVREWARRNVKG